MTNKQSTTRLSVDLKMKEDADGNRWSTSNDHTDIEGNRGNDKIIMDNDNYEIVNNNNHTIGTIAKVIDKIVNENNHVIEKTANGNNANVKGVSADTGQVKDRTEVSGSKVKVDARWSWVVLIATLVSSIISGGQLQSINIYYLIFLEEFRKSSSFTAWISAAQGTALCVAGPLSSFLLAKLGARMSIVGGALLMSACFAAIFFADSVPYLIVVFAFVGAAECMMSGGNMAAIATYFPRSSSSAMGIMFAGSGLGSMVTGMQVEWSVGEFGWRGAMLVQAAIVLQICVLGCLVLRPLTERKRNDVAVIGADQRVVSDDRGRGTSLKSLSRDPFFWTFVVSFLAFSANFSTMMTIFKGFVVSVGLESSFATALTTSSIGNMVGKALGGPLSQLLPAPLHLTAVASACALANALYVLVDRPWSLAVVAGAFGFCQGHMTIVWLLNVSWIYGPKEMPVVRGHIIFFGVICALSFPPIAGYTVDLTGSYNIAMVMSSASCVIIALCAMVTHVIHRRKSTPDRMNSYDVTGVRGAQLAPPGVQLVHYAPYVPALKYE